MPHTIDEGTAYGLAVGSYDSDLTEVGPGTPGGELLRRYWHPIALAAEATDLPAKIRVLGEDLILFRDGSGRPGLLYPRCCHRGTTLFYGKVEKDGIRCCYHGWKFDPEGRCLEQPCEPDGGRKRDHVRQPWYPLAERYGLIFAYQGPPAAKPPLPRYDILEDHDASLCVCATSRTLQTGGPEVMNCNWFQTWENVADPLHAPITHGQISGPQLGPKIAEMPDRVVFEEAGDRVRSNILRDEGDVTTQAVLEVILPNVSIVPIGPLTSDGRASTIGWALPIDDTHTKIFNAAVLPPEMADFDSTQMPVFGGQRWQDLDEQGHQRFPGDYEAQGGQGRITLHSQEHLVTSDRGVLMLRKLFRRQLRAVAKGETPVNAGPGADPMVIVAAGRYQRPSGTPVG